MSAIRRKFVLPAVGLMLAGAGSMLPATSGSAEQRGEAPALAYDVDFNQVEPTLDATPASVDLTPAVATAAALPSAAPVDSHELECMAKVVHHESRGQPRRGQLAVAQALINRLKAGRFGDSICAVAAQRGQFFNVASYNPRRDTDDWNLAEDVSRDALAGEAEQVAPGALFFRASYAAPNSFFRTRQRVTAVGGHIFYR
jgi:spore germination cell wall hydrolase CwlJ-like protein